MSYELGLCHSLSVPTILITQNIDDVPFDYRHRRCIPYDTVGVKWQDRLAKSLANTIRAVLADTDDKDELPWPYDTFAVKRTSEQSIISIEQPQEILLRGMGQVGALIARAFGPRGTNVSVTSAAHQVVSTRQGSVIAQGIHSPNPIEENGIDQMRKVSQSMSDTVGDGTKTAMLLALGLVDGGLAALKQGVPTKELLKAMETAVTLVSARLTEQSRPVIGDEVLSTALTASGDSAISNTVVRAFQQAGKDGVTMVETNNQPIIELQVSDGIQLDGGYLSPKFVTNAATAECELTDCRILLHDRKISNMKDLLPVLEAVARARQPLLVIADDVEGEALATLVVNNVRGTITCAAIRAPGRGDYRRAMLEDIAVVTGAQLLAADLGFKLESAALADLGSAAKVVVTQGETRIFGGGGLPDAIKSQIDHLRSAIDRTKNAYERERIQERLAHLAGSIATIKVGGITQLEIDERKYSAVSGMHSVRAAIEGGWNYGGGVGLLNARSVLAGRPNSTEADQIGVLVVQKAIERPFISLTATCGQDGQRLLGERDAALDPALGFNVESGALHNFERGEILDPTKTLCVAIEIAWSHARSILKTDTWSVNPIGSAEPDGF